MTPRAHFTFLFLAWEAIGPIAFVKDSDLTGWTGILLVFAGLTGAHWGEPTRDLDWLKNRLAR